MKKTRQEVFIIAILTFIITALWVYLSVYKTMKGASETPILTPEETRPLNPVLDVSVFEELKNRKK